MDMRNFYAILLLSALNVLVVSNLQAQNTCASCSATNQVNFNWSTAVGSGNELGAFATHGNKVGNFVANLVDVTVTVGDPNNRMTITNYENDPLIVGRGPYTNCYTRTNGSLGTPPGAQSLYSGYFQLGMFSTANTDRVTLEYTFSEPMLLCNLEISDIDYDGQNFSASGGTFQSYQDQVIVSASTGAGNVPIAITKATTAFGDVADVTVSGQTITANYVTGLDGDVPANSYVGKVFLTTASAITRLVITYSNGPADEGSSNDHHIRIGNLSGCKTPSNVPVTIVDFNGSHFNGQSYLNLLVANQQNMAAYELQKSVDGRNFTTVSSLPATSATQYAFTDDKPANGANFYRIQGRDRNGEISYSKVIRLDVISKLGFSIKSQGSQVILQANSDAAKKISVSIFNTGGTVVGTQEFRLAQGVNLLNLEALNNQPSGMYFIVVNENGSRVYNTKVVK
jgi:hypothetical protein